jgi:hypothetical protein
MSSVDVEGTWSDPILTVIGAPTTTVDAQPVSRLAVWPNSADPEFKLQPGSFPGSVETDWTILAGTIAACTHVIPSTGHRTWQEYRELPGHVWFFWASTHVQLGALLGLPVSLIPLAGVQF